MAENPDKTTVDGILSDLNEVNKKMRSLSKVDVTNASKWFHNKFTTLINAAKHAPISKTSSALNKFPAELEKSQMAARITPMHIGRMFMFVYDPKTKAELPYYDTFPLVLLVGMREDGFVGLNLHYVPPLVRSKIIEALIRNVNPKYLENDFLTRNVENKQIVKNYQILYETSKLPAMGPCFKRYLYSHVKSNYMHIDPSEWAKAVLLPTERFKKASKTSVWADSVSASRPKRKSRAVKLQEASNVAATAAVAKASTVKPAGLHGTFKDSN